MQEGQSLDLSDYGVTEDSIDVGFWEEFKRETVESLLHNLFETQE